MYRWLFPGSPSISVGFTENIAWGATVNSPDLVDVFVLDINPENEYQYRLDGEWRDLERSEVDIELTLWILPWTVSREILPRAWTGCVPIMEPTPFVMREWASFGR